MPENACVAELEDALSREIALRQKYQRMLRLKEERWRQELEALHNQIDLDRERHVAELETLMTRTLQARDELDGVLRSASWRITRPLRALRRFSSRF